MEYLREEFLASGERIPSLAVADRMLRDSFYYGVWVINAGKKNERVVDLREISLPDGTQFQPVISKEGFERLQKVRSQNSASSAPPRKRENPFPRMVTCESCRRSMYATFRKIARAGGIREEQLGYECQNRECSQGRFKCDILIDYVAGELMKRTKPLGRRDYQKYVLAVQLFSRRKSKDLASERGRINRSLRELQDEKRRLIEQKAKLVSKDAFDKHSREYFDSRVSEIAEVVESLECKKGEAV